MQLSYLTGSAQAGEGRFSGIADAFQRFLDIRVGEGTFFASLRPHANAFGGALGALAGAGIFYGLGFDPSWVWGLFGIGLGLVIWASAWRKLVTALGFALCMAGMVFVLAWWQVERAVTFDYAAAARPHWLVGTVEGVTYKDEVEGKAKRAVMRLKEVEAYGLGEGKVEGASVGIFANQAKDLKVGDGVAVQAILMSPEGPKFNGQRDGRLWRYFNGGWVAGYAVGSVEETWRAPKKVGRFEGFFARVEDIRQRVFERTKGLANGAVAALLVGQEKAITPELREAYRATGLSHLLAISGMQLTLVAMGVFWLVRWVGAWVPWVALRVDLRLWAAICGLAAVFFYTLLAGAGVSVVRASLMAAIVMLAVLSGRLRSAERGWCAAVMMVLLVSPVMVTRAGFILSICAVLALILLARSEEGKGHGTFGWIRELVLATVVAGAATAPVLVWFFGQFSMVGMAANLVAVPLMALATYLGMVGLVLSPVGWDGPILAVMGEIVGWVNGLAGYFYKWEFASVEVGREWWWVVAVFAVIVVVSILLKRFVEAGIGLVGMVAWMGVVAVTTPKADVLIWDGGKVGLVRVVDTHNYKVLWAERAAEAERLAKLARVTLVGRARETVADERYMPVISEENFAWAEWRGGKWNYAPVSCGRIWEKMSEECEE